MVHPPRISMWNGHPADASCTHDIGRYSGRISNSPKRAFRKYVLLTRLLNRRRTVDARGVPRALGKMPMPRIVVALLILLTCIRSRGAEPQLIPDDFPRFIV